MREADTTVILGLGVSGRSAAAFLLDQGEVPLIGIDQNRSLFGDAAVLALQDRGMRLQGEEEPLDWNSIKRVILSPGIPPDHSLVLRARQHQIPCTGEIALGCCYVQHPLIGITGTNGKTTVTLLIRHLLNSAGKRARAVGNVGVPLTQELSSLQEGEQWVVELSSYQIETLDVPCLSSAVVLNITPDHLDRYACMQEYAAAKCRIARALKAGSDWYMEETTWKTHQEYVPGKKPRLYGYAADCEVYTDLSDLFFLGRKETPLPQNLKGKRSHDLENFLAAYALCRDRGLSPEEIMEGWKSFKKPAHRLEFVGEWDGIRYYDDSKGTNIDAVVRAVEALPHPILLIAGGVDKGFPYSFWIPHFKNRVKSIYAIGQSAALIEAQLRDDFSVVRCSDLSAAVRAAAQDAVKGDAVLLSPGCSSYDMFKNYAHRGEEFQRIVLELRKTQ